MQIVLSGGRLKDVRSVAGLMSEYVNIKALYMDSVTSYVDSCMRIQVF